ncbi:histidine kinase [Pseudoxanthomonas sp. PXM04]|uniref:histidine kinase n=1 Tax=Pseudoxanthomonas sp. PXM04 TaxID=2769297 RepID=UPI00177F6617|nr:histidine kinase [Pseudoxanthomonas sp. PXM04]
MFASLFFIIRIFAAWSGVLLLAGLIWAGTFNVVTGNDDAPGPVFALLALLVALSVVISTFSHLRRVSLVAGRLDHDTLSNRQHRRIEIPLEADEAFLLVESAVRELPRVEELESARDSLQVKAKLKRVDPYGNDRPARYNVFNWFSTKRNQILATVTPGAGSCSVSLLCEPEASTWSDLLKVDNGTNLENAEAIVRAIARRIGERRREEKADTVQTVTEKELTVAKLNLLQAQVEPHFLYNTLASAQVLTRTDPARADLMLGHLIQYLRRSLPRAENAVSTLGEEAERAEAYLEILKIRMGNRLNTQVEIPEALRDVAMPSMMLQTLVENAIKHGLEPKPGGGTIWIIAREQEGQVAITVADDGQGFGNQTGGTGIGLKNLRERLRLTYGGNASFAIISNFPQGVAATLNLPSKPAGVARHA